MTDDEEVCNKCGKEATVRFGGEGIPEDWWCKDCLYKAYPQFKPMFEHAEKLAEEMETEVTSSGRVLH